ncbi:heavy metal sensor histidine kinase [Massilia sp. H6]|uniref:heavy metal sensor histidine kinase n=1 Tax=Massilia sp. H6 TaxID=2970464 RepID=UPI0021681C1B|nr:heavy metal sensor histidine kinase [Massilia sp. H6]UVW30053.1 heavy metal sensor histidine kinase [Massilia sp. H6]
MILRSLRSQLALLVGLLGLVQAVAILAFSYFTIASKLEQQRRQQLTSTLAEARQVLGNADSLATIGQSAHRLADLVGRHEGMHAAVARPADYAALVAFSPVSVQSLARLRSDTWGPDAFLDWNSMPGGAPMLSVVTLSSVRNGDDYVLMLTADRSSDAEVLSNFLRVALSAAPFALALVSFGAWLIVNVGLRPLNRLREAAVVLSAKNIPKRIDPAGMPLELMPLCQAFNGMLDRLEDGIERLSQFSGDLAHEMRTPLATLLGRTQSVLSQPRSHEQLIQLLADNVEELERLTRIVADMLFLAQADAPSAQLHAVAVDLTQEAKKIADYIGLLAQERNMVFRIQGEGTVWADLGLVDRAITNLLSNAVRYGAPDSVVDIVVGSVADCVELRVINCGQPIPAEHLPRLFDRFYRADSARSREAGGTGLGLSIVAAIMSLHGGRAAVASGVDGRTILTLSFPLAHARPRPG